MAYLGSELLQQTSKVKLLQKETLKEEEEKEEQVDLNAWSRYVNATCVYVCV